MYGPNNTYVANCIAKLVLKHILRKITVKLSVITINIIKKTPSIYFIDVIGNKLLNAE
jgi:ribosomal protein L25 (general stress protein Ctc)